MQGATEAEVAHTREQVRRSSRVATVSSERGADGHIGAYLYRAKWYGAHWVLVTLAEFGPAGEHAASGWGFPAEHRYHRHTRAMVPSQRSLLDWGGVSRRHLNPCVSRAVILHAAGRQVDVAVETAEI